MVGSDFYANNPNRFHGLATYFFYRFSFHYTAIIFDRSMLVWFGIAALFSLTVTGKIKPKLFHFDRFILLGKKTKPTSIIIFVAGTILFVIVLRKLERNVIHLRLLSFNGHYCRKARCSRCTQFNSSSILRDSIPSGSLSFIISSQWQQFS